MGPTASPRTHLLMVVWVDGSVMGGCTVLWRVAQVCCRSRVALNRTAQPAMTVFRPEQQCTTLYSITQASTTVHTPRKHCATPNDTRQHRTVPNNTARGEMTPVEGCHWLPRAGQCCPGPYSVVEGCAVLLGLVYRAPRTAQGVAPNNTTQLSTAPHTPQKCGKAFAKPVQPASQACATVDRPSTTLCKSNNGSKVLPRARECC